MGFRNAFIAGVLVSIAMYVAGVLLSFSATRLMIRSVLFNEGFGIVALLFLFSGVVASLFEEYREKGAFVIGIIVSLYLIGFFLSL